MPLRTDAEYYIDNKDKIKDMAKCYRINNIEKVRENQRRQTICECGGHYTISHKFRHFESKLHYLPFTEYLDDSIHTKNCYGIDMIKCRRNLLINSNYNYCVFSVLEKQLKILFIN